MGAGSDRFALHDQADVTVALAAGHQAYEMHLAGPGPRAVHIGPLWTRGVMRRIILDMADSPPEQDPVASFVDRAIIKTAYKPVGVIASVAAGALASAIFGRVWRAVAGAKSAPKATDQAKSWADILPAAALHGLVYATVKAVVIRATAEGFERATGRWPGKRSGATESAS